MLLVCLLRRISHGTLFSFFAIVITNYMLEGNFNQKRHTREHAHNTTATHSVGNTSAGIRKVVQLGPHCPKNELPK